MRAASITTADPAALSCAPSDATQLSRCAPDITIAGVGVATRQVGEDVVGVAILVVVAHDACELHGRLGARFREACDLPIVLGRKLEAGQLRRLAHPVSIAFAVQQTAVAAGHAHPRARAFAGEKGVAPLFERRAAQASLDVRLGRDFGLPVLVEVAESGIRMPSKRRLRRLRPVVRPRDEHDSTLQLAPPLVEIPFTRQRRDDDLRPDCAVRARRPRDRDRAIFVHTRSDELAR